MGTQTVRIMIIPSVWFEDSAEVDAFPPVPAIILLSQEFSYKSLETNVGFEKLMGNLSANIHGNIRRTLKYFKGLHGRLNTKVFFS